MAKILISGASGLIGRALVATFNSAGHTVFSLTRRSPKPDSGCFYWDPTRRIIEIPLDTKFDVVINLAGEGIANGRWSKQRKQHLRDSRIQSTKLLGKALAASPPKLLLSASATGIYGNGGEELLSESSQEGGGFLASLAHDWEASAQVCAQELRCRLCLMRFGVVLSPHGGALGQMLLPFKLGLGGRFGNGRQWMSWIGIGDAVRAISHLINNDHIQGPVNITTPSPVINLEFTHTLARILRRPALLPIPAFLLRLIFGELADQLLLSSARVHPSRLLETGFTFEAPTLEEALCRLLMKK